MKLMKNLSILEKTHTLKSFSHFCSLFKTDLEQLAEDQKKLANCVKSLQEQFLSLTDQNARIEQILGELKNYF